jgi:hypothetical protein
MKKSRKRIASLLSVAALGVAASAPVHAITFSEFVSGTDLANTLQNNATIGFAFAGDKFVGSVYFGTNNNQLYSTNLSGGNVAKFGPVIPGASGEIYVSSSLGLGGFPSRDIYAAQGNNIFHIDHNGTSGSTFNTTPLDGGVRGIAFDPYGLYGNDMLVTTTSGSIYRINKLGQSTLLANVGEDTEGLDFAPQKFGNYAQGTLFVASEGSGSIRAIAPDGGAQTVATVPSGEMLSFVPVTLGSSGSTLEGFYAARYPSNVVKAGASEFQSLLGDAVVTSETGNAVYQVHWDGKSFVTNSLGSFGGQPEDGIFVTEKILRPTVPEPSTYAMLAMGLGAVGFAARRRRR